MADTDTTTRAANNGSWDPKVNKDRRKPGSSGAPEAETRPILKMRLGTGEEVQIPLTPEQAVPFYERGKRNLEKADVGQTLDNVTRVVTLILGILSVAAAGTAIYLGVKSKSSAETKT